MSGTENFNVKHVIQGDANKESILEEALRNTINAVSDAVTITFSSDANKTVSTSGDPSEFDGMAHAFRVTLSGTVTGTKDLVVPAANKHVWLIKNSTSAAAITVKVTGQPGVTIPNGQEALVYQNGTDIQLMVRPDDTQILHKGSDQTAIGTSFADVTGLGFAVLANTTYAFEYFLICDADATTTGIDVAVNGPASPTNIDYEQVSWTSTTVQSIVGATAYDNNTANANSNGTTRRIFVVRGILRNGANAGTLIPRAKREVAGTGPNVRAGSWGKLTRLN